MAYSQLTHTQLYIVDTGHEPDAPYPKTWLECCNDNWGRLNDTLLKITALLDVDDSGIANGQVLKYNSSSQDWEPWTPQRTQLTTTTTT